MIYNNQTIIAILLGVGLLGGIYLRDQNIILTISGALAGMLTVSKSDKVTEVQKTTIIPPDEQIQEKESIPVDERA